MQLRKYSRISRKRESVVSSKQCTSLHIRYRDHKNKWVEAFTNNKEVESAVNSYFKKLDGPHYEQGIEAVENPWEKCIELKGDYVRK